MQRLVALLLMAASASAFVPAGRAQRAATALTVPRTPAPRAVQNLDGTGSLRDVQEYPCTLDIKIIGENACSPFVGSSHPDIRGPFVDDVVAAACAITKQEEADVKVHWRDRGKYRSVTMSLHFEDADQVYAVYAAMDADPRVKYKL